ncbi:MAG: hypothetical protein ACKO1J_09950 [Tagaea sp.]
MPKTPKRAAPKLDKRLTRAQLDAELARATAAADRGEWVSDAAVGAWIASLGTKNELPVPSSKRAARKRIAS